MANIFLKHLRTLAITSATLTSSYYLSSNDQRPNRLFSVFIVNAAEYVNICRLLIKNERIFFLRNDEM